MASVKWSQNALVSLEDLDAHVRERVLSRVSWLEENFMEVAPEPLRRELKGLYKLRIGDYRVIYSLRQDMLIIEAVGHRRDIYKF